MAEAQNQHQHDQEHSHGQTTTTLSHDERNKAHWDKVASTYNSEHTQKAFGNLINTAHEFVLANINSIGVDFLDPSQSFEDSSKYHREIRVLDYACGPGTITSILAGRATEYIGIDLSSNMVNEYNERFSNQGGEQVNAKAYNANLFDPKGLPEVLDDAKFRDFDLVAVGFGFHHFENLPMVTSRLVERLKVGGVLMILDFYSHKEDDLGADPASMTIAHHGFTEAQITALFEKAGLSECQVLDFGQDVHIKGHAVRRPFMATGKKVE